MRKRIETGALLSLVRGPREITARLVCFAVYPKSAPAAVKVAFREYDHAFARALGVPLYRPKEGEAESYEISVVLAETWWDDGSWDFRVA